MISPSTPARLRIGDELGDAVAVDRIVIAHEDERRRHVVGAEVAHQIERQAQRHARLQRAQAGGLDRRAVGHRIGERHADLDEIGAGFRQPLDEARRGRAVGIAGGQKGDEPGAALLAQGGEAPRDTSLRVAHSVTPSALGDGEDVLVAAAAEIEHEQMVARQSRRDLRDMGQSMRRLERRDDALHARAELEGLERLVVVDRDVLDAAEIVEPGMLRPDAGIVEPGRDRMRVLDLPVLVLQKICPVAVQHAGHAAVERGRVLAGLDAVAAGLDPDHAHALVVEEGMEEADGVRAAADAGDERIGQPSLGALELLANLVADHRLEVAHHRGIRCGPAAVPMM